jgi:hypothetical protein
MDAAQPDRISTVGRVLAAVGHDAAFGWRLGPRLARALFLMPLAGAVAVAASSLHPPAFRFLTAEGALLEWLQFAGYAAAGAIGLAIAGRLRHAGRHRDFGLYLLFALACLLAAGEEIDWGQREFGWGVPRTIAALHHLGATTLHTGVVPTLNAALLATGGYGLVVPWLMRRSARRGQARELARMVVPPLFLSSAFLVVFAYGAAGVALAGHPHAGIGRLGEWPGLCLAFSLSSFALLNQQRLRRVRTPVLPVGWTAPGGAERRQAQGPVTANAPRTTVAAGVSRPS